MVGSSTAGALADDLPPGLDVDTAITDYLIRLSKYALDHLQAAYGEDLTMRDLQWCLTVPAIWDDSARQRMHVVAEKAGMVTGCHCPRSCTVASPHTLMLVVESEAASFYCLKHWAELQLKRKVSLGKGDQYMVVDIGGGTTNIVVHESTCSTGSTGDSKDTMEVKEVTACHGGLAGGAYADRNFTDLVHRRVGCFQDFVRGQRSMQLELHHKWEMLKTSYTGNLHSPAMLRFPQELAKAWRKHDEDHNHPPLECYDVLVISNEDMRAAFDPVVEEIVRLVEEKLSKTMLVVGGFASSKYVEKQLRQKFADRMNGNIVYLSNPGSAICYGDVLMGMAIAGVQSRIARKSYGISIVREFWEGVDPERLRLRNNEGLSFRPNLYDKVVDWLVEKGQTLVTTEAAGSREYRPHTEDQTELAIDVYSTSESRPSYTDDPGVVHEGRHVMDISHDLEKGCSRHVNVSMYFGGTSIAITGRRVDFDPTDQIDRFEVTS